ncbi:MAG TPA: radical SAM protein, partial [Sphingobium sp.]|nr:radical SAM protein [Sphingobium sp.]
MAVEKGRGATLNQASRRFNLAEHSADGDWLDALDLIDGPAPKRRTEVTV